MVRWLLVFTTVLVAAGLLWLGRQPSPAAQVGAMLLTAAGAVVLLPPLLGLLTRSHRWADDELPGEWNELARRQGLWLPPIWVWQTGGRRVGAICVGLVPGFRGVVLTDGLLARLNAAELTAIVAHELAHLRRRHPWLRLVVLLAPLGPWLVAAALGASFSASRTESIAALRWANWVHGSAGGQLAFVLVWAAYALVVFGWVARRMELDADWQAVRWSRQAMQPPGSYAAALGSLADAAGLARDRWTWQHGRIQDRLDFLERIEVDPRLGRRLEGQIRLIGAVATGTLATGLAAALATCSGQAGGPLAWFARIF